MAADVDDLEGGFSNLAAILKARAARHPDALAYTFLTNGVDTNSVTFGELDARCQVVAAELERRGAAGARVLLLYPQSLDFAVGFMGCLYAGAVAIPVSLPSSTRGLSRLGAVVDDAQAHLALTTRSQLATLQPHLESLGQTRTLAWLATDTLGTQAAPGWRLRQHDPSAIAFLQYTSGSTSLPKGVMVTHANLLHNEQAIRACFEVTRTSTCVSWLPLFHDMGLMSALLQTVYSGNHCLLMSPLRFLGQPVRWLQAISKYKAVYSGAPNFAYELCIERVTPEERRALDLSSWRFAFNGAEPVRATTLERFASAFADCGVKLEAMVPAYGLAENTLVAAVRPPYSPLKTVGLRADALADGKVQVGSGESARISVSCGVSIQGQEVAIVDAATGRRCAADQIGEIWLKGPSVAAGYWRREQETKETFGAHTAEGDGPFLRTGDLGFLHEGEVHVAGRLKDLIIVHGANHYPQDLELTAEQSHPALPAGFGCAFSVSVDGEEKIVLVQGVKRSELPDTADVIDAIRRALGEDHGVPVAAIVLTEQRHIPKTSSGKVQRRAARAAFLDGSLPVVARWDGASGAAGTEARSRPFVAPRDETERRVAALWCEVLGLPRVSVNDSFFEVGGHSLTAMQLAARLEQQFGRVVPFDGLARCPDVASQARWVAEQPGPAATWSPLVPLQPEGTKPSLYFVHPMGGQVVSYIALAHELGKDQPFYGLQAKGRTPGLAPTETIEDMAREYVAAIRQHQTQGPYFIAGWCFGGLVALEMAKQMREASLPIGLVMLLDSAFGPQTVEDTARHDHEIDVDIVRNLFIDFGPAGDDSSRERLLALPPEELLPYALERLHRTEKFPKAFGMEHFRTFVRVSKANWKAQGRYKLSGRIEAPVTVFLAADTSRSAGWSNLVDGWNGIVQPDRVYRVPGTHVTMVEPPHVTELARKIQEALGEAARARQ
jgi:acyl-CoA synthetase (AMP-forming)/AMP-acid ligase II/thioesterase domain-containing protein/acyl carrier protein